MAIKLATRELKTNPAHQLLRRIVIDLLLKAEDYAQAEAFIADWSWEEGTGQARQLRATLLLAQKNYAGAEQGLKAMLGENPEDVTSLHLLAAVYESTHRREEANQQYETILKIEPADVWANNNLGFSLALGNERLDDAHEMIRLALRQGGGAAAIVDSMGWVLYKQGRFGQAVAYLSRAVRLIDEPQGELLDHLGDAFYRLKEKSRASEAWKAALQAQTNGKQADADLVKRLQEKLNMVESKQVPPVSWSVVDRAD